MNRPHHDGSKRLSRVGVSLAAGILISALATGSLRPALQAPTEAASSRTPRGGAARGALRSYELHLDARASLQLSALVPRSPGQTRTVTGEQAMTRAVVIDGVVEEVVLEATADGGTVGVMHGVNAGVTRDGVPAPELARALATGIVVDRAGDGHVRRVRLPDEIDAESQGMIEHVAELVQVAAPADPAAGSWSGAEASVLGDASTRYERRPDGAIGKRVASVVDRAAPTALGALVPSIDAALDVVLDDDGTLRGLHGRYETTLTAAAAAEPVARTTSTVAATGLARGLDVARAAELGAQLDTRFGAWRRLGEARAAATTPPPEVLARLTGGRSLPELIDDVQAGQGEGTGRLLAYLRLHPEAVRDAATALAEMKVQDRGADRLLGVLGMIDSDASQEALAGVADGWRRTDPRAAEVVVELLGGSREPSAATEDYLRAHRADGGDAAVTADLALGRVAAAVGGEDPDRARAIVDELAEELADAPPERLPGLIAALGNTASPAILDIVAPYLDHASTAVRRQAVRAVGRIPGAAADGLLAGSITVEPEDDPLAFAIEIVAHRPVASIVHDALATRAGEPHTDHVRAAITAELARH